MKILDYIFYYLYRYYSSGVYKLKWSTPQEWAIYVMCIGLLLWGFLVQFLLDKYLNFNFNPSIEKVIFFVILGVFYFSFYLRYIKFEHYILIDKKYNDQSDAVWRPGTILSICVVIVIPIILIVILIFTHKN